MLKCRIFFFSLFIFLFLLVVVSVSVLSAPPFMRVVGSMNFSTNPGIDQGDWEIQPEASITWVDNQNVTAYFKHFGDGSGIGWFELDDYANMSSVDESPMWRAYIDVPSITHSTSLEDLWVNCGITYYEQPNIVSTRMFGCHYFGDPANNGVFFSPGYSWSSTWWPSDANSILPEYNMSDVFLGGCNVTVWMNGSVICINTTNDEFYYNTTDMDSVSVDFVNKSWRYFVFRFGKQKSGTYDGSQYIVIRNLTYGYVLENSAPNVTLISPENDNETLWYNNTYGRVNFVWNISDPDGDFMDVFLYTSDDNSTFNITGNWNGQNNTSYMSNYLDYINGSAILPNSTYWWYVACRDDEDFWGNSSVWNFTTSNYTNLVPHYELIFPSDGLVNVSTDYIDLQLRVWDNDLGLFAPHPYTDYLNVTFFDNSTGEVLGYYTASNNSTASVRWSGLNSTTLYFWYATVNDWWVSNTTDVYSFYTGYVLGNGTFPFIYDIKPYDGKVLYYSKPDIVEMGFTCWDVDSDYVDIFLYWADFYYNGSVYWPDELFRVTRLESCSSGDGERYEWDAKNSYGYDFVLNDTYYWRIKAVDSDGHSVWFPRDVGVSPDSYYSFNVTYDVNGEDDPNKSDDFPSWWDDIVDSWLRWIVIACIVLISSSLVLWISKSIIGAMVFVFFGLVVCWGLNLLYDVEMFVVLVGLVILFVLSFISGR